MTYKTLIPATWEAELGHHNLGMLGQKQDSYMENKLGMAKVVKLA
jgi:hypothetical protein